MLTDTKLRNLKPQDKLDKVNDREVVSQVFRWAIERGQKVENPADQACPTTIAKFEPSPNAMARLSTWCGAVNFLTQPAGPAVAAA